MGFFFFFVGKHLWLYPALVCCYPGPQTALTPWNGTFSLAEESYNCPTADPKKAPCPLEMLTILSASNKDV